MVLSTRRRHHQPHGPLASAASSPGPQCEAPYCLLLESAPSPPSATCRRPHIDAHPDKPPHHVGAHAAKSDHSELHQWTPLEEPIRRPLRFPCCLWSRPPAIVSSPRTTPSGAPKTDEPATRTWRGPNNKGRGHRVEFHPSTSTSHPGLSRSTSSRTPPDLGERSPEKWLVPKPGSTVITSTWSRSWTISSEHSRYRRGLIGHATTRFPQRSDSPHRAMQDCCCPPSGPENVFEPAASELVEKEIGVGDHQVGLEGQLRHPAKRLDDHCAQGGWAEVSVHHVHVDPIRPGPLPPRIPGRPGGRSRRSDRGGTCRQVGSCQVLTFGLGRARARSKMSTNSRIRRANLVDCSSRVLLGPPRDERLPEVGPPTAKRYKPGTLAAVVNHSRTCCRLRPGPRMMQPTPWSGPRAAPLSTIFSPVLAPVESSIFQTSGFDLIAAGAARSSRPSSGRSSASSLSVALEPVRAAPFPAAPAART
jgi:hypothetical protein